jgi:hypothetical protein
MHNWLKLDKLKLDAEMKIREKKDVVGESIEERTRELRATGAREADIQQDKEIREIRNKLEEGVQEVKNGLKTDLELRKTEMRYQKNILRSLAYNPTLFQAITRKGPSGQEYSSASDLERLDNWARSKHGQYVDEFDPAMARLSKDLSRSHYEINFLGVIPVRSGRAMSSGYGRDGYIATGQAAFGPGLMDPKRGNWVNTEWSEMDAISSSYQGLPFLENIPVIRHLTYGNFLRAMAFPAVKAAQPFVAASRLGVLKAEGLPSPYEPQYAYDSDWKGGAKGFVQAMGTYMPFPLNLPFAATAMLNPSKGGKFSYKIYEAFARAGFRNYAMEGKTDWATLYSGGPNSRMGYIDKFYTSTYAGGYQPVNFNTPYGDVRMFPAWAATTSRAMPGFMQGRADAAYSNIFRTETRAFDMQKERNMEEAGQGAKRELAGLVWPIALGMRAKRSYDQLAHNMQSSENYKETSRLKREEEMKEGSRMEDRRQRDIERRKKYRDQKRDI